MKKPGAARKARKRPVAKAVATPVVPPSMPNPMTRYRYLHHYHHRYDYHDRDDDDDEDKDT